MDIDRSLVKAFVDVLPKNAKNTEGTVYGTVVTYDEELHVQIDGSSSVIPIKSLPATASVKNGDRVIVQLKDHNATITGNLSDQSVSGTQLTEQVTRFDTIIADKASIDELDAQKATIEELAADYVTVNGRLDAAYAEIDKLVAEDVTITGKLEANEAEFESLYSDYADFKILTADELYVASSRIFSLEVSTGSFENLTTDNFASVNADIGNLNTNKLDANFANIDYANINKAHIGQLYAQSGIIENMEMKDGVITGDLYGVRIHGDLIDAGTIIADRLVLTGKDGLYREINADAGAVTSEIVTEADLQNGIHGGIVIDKTIVADKIAVSDLTAFEAKLANFTIDIDDTTKVGELYSGVKDSVDNTTTGIYLSSDGQMAIGDSNNYLKFYKDGAEYKFELSLLDNFMSLDDDGLQLGDRRGGIWNGYRTRTTGDSYDILDEDGTVLAQYKANEINLGMNNDDTIIRLCNNRGRIRYDSVTKYLDIIGGTLRLYGESDVWVWANYQKDNTHSQAVLEVQPGRAILRSESCHNLEGGSWSGMVDKYNTSEFIVKAETGTDFMDGKIYGLADNVDFQGRYNATFESTTGDVDLNSPFGNVNVNGMTIAKNNVLWAGTTGDGTNGYYMTADHTASLSGAISAQANGVILVFSRYSNGVLNHNFSCHFIPKWFVSAHYNQSITFMLPCDSYFSMIGGKRLYIRDTTIHGVDDNKNTGTSTTGITYTNNGFVLRYVIGV